MMENPKSPRVRRIAGLARKKGRLAEGSFLVEGPQAVRELLVHRADLAEAVFLTEGHEPWRDELVQLAKNARVQLEYATPEVLAALAETVTPQGVIAVAAIESASVEGAANGARLAVVLHEVRDPGNAGTVLRAADAVGADLVIFAGDSIDPWHPKVVRSTTGSLFHIPVAVVPTLAEAVSQLRDAGMTVLAADVRGDELTPATAGLNGRIGWVFGNEARGLTESDRALTDRSLKLPIYGQAESLNLATAASVCLYTTAFAQRK